MGNLKPIDSALVKDVDYDLISPDTVGGEYIETIGAACENPDGYTRRSLFLGRENGVQHLYRATAAIAFGETIILDTNCAYTTVSGELEGKAEESEVSSLNEALTNKTDDIDSVISTNGAKNLVPNNLTSQVNNGLTITVNSDGTITINGTSTGLVVLYLARFRNLTYLKSGERYILSGCPQGGSDDGYYLTVSNNVDAQYQDFGEGIEFSMPELSNYTLTALMLVVRNNITISNLIFKPMLTLAVQPNSDYAHYVPYAKPNEALTKELEHFMLQGIGVATTNVGSKIKSGGDVCIAIYGKVAVISVYAIANSSMSANDEIFTLNLPSNAIVNSYKTTIKILEGSKVLKANKSYSANEAIMDQLVVVLD